MNALPRTGAGLFALVAAAAFAAVGAALVSQHVFAMQPCPWCVLQRLVFVLIGLSAIAGVVVARMGERLVAWIVAGEVAALAALGVAAALWQHFVAAATTSCNRTLADRIVNGLGLDGWLPDVFAPRASCADAAVKLLGVPYEFWSLALFVVLGVLALRAAAAVRGG